MVGRRCAPDPPYEKVARKLPIALGKPQASPNALLRRIVPFFSHGFSTSFAAE